MTSLTSENICSQLIYIQTFKMIDIHEKLTKESISRYKDQFISLTLSLIKKQQKKTSFLGPYGITRSTMGLYTSIYIYKNDKRFNDNHKLTIASTCRHRRRFSTYHFCLPLPFFCKNPSTLRQ